ncbi:MAG: hypothetical protein GYA59_01400 [Chloroflexi bacterium]|nr:hypothetical protein [Chloroflexota bacterium]
MSKETVEQMKAFQPTDLPSALFQAPVVEVPEGQWPIVLKTLELQPTIQQFLGTCPYTLIQQHQKITALATDKNLPIRFLGYSPIFTGTRVYRGQGCDWALMNLTSDPLFYANGEKLIIPAAAAADIKTTVKAGINFDAMFIAHEIPSGSVKPGESVPLELIAPPPPPQVKQRLEKLDTAAGTFWQGVGSAIGSILSMGAATATTFALPLAIVDPVLFGVYLDQSWLFQGQPIGMWYYVTHWYWPAEEGSK